MTKQSEVAIAYFIGHDPVRHERLAAIGKNGTQFAFIKRMTFSFVHSSTWKTDTLHQKRCGFLPQN